MVTNYLHTRNFLDRRGTGTNNSNTLTLPLLSLILWVPFRRMQQLSLENIEPFDIRPFSIILDPTIVQQYVCKIFKFPNGAILSSFAALDLPLAFQFHPFGTVHVGIEPHILFQVKNLRHVFDIARDFRST